MDTPLTVRLLQAFERMGALFILLVVVIGVGWLADGVGRDAVIAMNRMAKAIEDQTSLQYVIYDSQRRGNEPSAFNPPGR